ncbi:MAG TPA: HlyD family efflux transporter periplasmic adaptor subunit [Kofleriaceae bacterium]|nr:HlyD family efflux transporter periplasmic adaptor subunit [Kofleriaceae bacterium]
MIENATGIVWGLLLAAASAWVMACGEGEPPPGYQGVIELEERDLGFEVGGRVLAIHVVEGDEIAPDQLVAALDDAVQRSARDSTAEEAAAARAQSELVREGAREEEIRAAAAEVEAARAQEQMLLTHLERERRLLARDATTRAQVLDLEAQHRAAVAERRAREQRVRALREGARSSELAGAAAQAGAAESRLRAESERLALYELRALEGGTVLDVEVEPGEVVSPGAPVVTVADTARPYADVFVPQDQLGEISVGAPAQVRVDSLAEPLVGQVEHIARRTEFTPRFLFSERERPNLVVRVRIRIEDPDRLLHAGVPAFVTIGRAPQVARGGAE